MVDTLRCVIDLFTSHKRLISDSFDHIKRFNPKFIGFEVIIKAYFEHDFDKVQPTASFGLTLSMKTYLVSK